MLYRTKEVKPKVRKTFHWSTNKCKPARFWNKHPLQKNNGEECNKISTVNLCSADCKKKTKKKKHVHTWIQYLYINTAGVLSRTITCERFYIQFYREFINYRNNMRKQIDTEDGWDYLCIHILFFEYEWTYFIWVHVENSFQQRRLQKKRAIKNEQL